MMEENGLFWVKKKKKKSEKKFRGKYKWESKIKKAKERESMMGWMRG